MYDNLIKVIKRELYRMSKDYVLPFVAIVGPVFVFLLTFWLFSAGVVRDMPITVVDNDMSKTSRKISRLCDATPAAKIRHKTASLTEAKRLLEHGKTDAILYIPDKTERKIMKGESAEIKLYINNTNLVKGGLLKSGLYTTLSTISAGIRMEVYKKNGATQHQAFEKVQPIKISTRVLFNPFGNYSYFLALGVFLMMLTLFTFLGSIYVLGLELKDNTAGELMETAGGNILIALLGKLSPYTFLFFVDAMLMNLILFDWMGTPFRGSLGVIIASEILVILAYQSIAILFLSLTANLRLSLSFGSAYTLMALTFAGLTFPSFGMPLIARLFGYVFPYTIWLQSFMDQSLRGKPLILSVQLLLVLLIYIAIGLLAIPSFKKHLLNPAKWGKN